MLKKFLAGIAFVIGLTTLAIASFNPVPLSSFGAAQEHYYSSVVALRMKQGKSVAGCTGTLIHDLRPFGHNVGFVLTAAHCVKDAESIEVGFYPDNTGAGAPIIKAGARWRWPTSFSDKTQPDSPGIDMNDLNADQVHDWAIVMVKDLPAHVRVMGIGAPWRPDGSETGENSVFLVARNEEDKGLWISPLFAVPFQGSLPFGVMERTRMWRSDVVQPLDPNGLRGLCMGNSGGPVVKVVNGRPVLVGVASAEGNSFGVLGNKPTFRCGTNAYWYNATLAITDLEDAIKGEMQDDGILPPDTEKEKS